MLQDFQSMPDHFGTLYIKGLKGTCFSGLFVMSLKHAYKQQL